MARWRKYRSGRTGGNVGEWQGVILFDDEYGDARIRWEVNSFDIGFVSCYVGNERVYVASAERRSAKDLFERMKQEVESFVDAGMSAPEIRAALSRQFPEIDYELDFPEVIKQVSMSKKGDGQGKLERLLIEFKRRVLVFKGIDDLTCTGPIEVTRIETLSIVRKRGIIEFKIDDGCGRTSTFTGEDPSAVSKLLNSIIPYNFEPPFSSPQEASSPLVIDERDVRTYRIYASWENGEETHVEGRFARGGVPTGFELIAASVNEVLEEKTSLYMLYRSVFDKPLRHEDEVFLCSVRYKRGGETYTYRTTDSKYDLDDFVIVPVGKEGRKKIAQIEAIVATKVSELAMPLSELKEIERPATKNEILCDWKW